VAFLIGPGRSISFVVPFLCSFLALLRTIPETSFDVVLFYYDVDEISSSHVFGVDQGSAPVD
jgi:hypothetical protein